MFDAGNAKISFAQIDGLYLPGQPPITGKGKWGIRVNSKTRFPSTGDEVLVTKANGTYQRVTVGVLLGRDPHAFPAEARYYTIQHDGDRRDRPPTKRQVRSDFAARQHAAEAARIKDVALATLRGEYREIRDQLGTLEAGYERYEGYDGENDDLMRDLRNRLTEIVTEAQAVKAA